MTGTQPGRVVMQLSDNARGVVIMCVAMLAFVVNDTAVKAVTARVPLYEVIALRGAFSVLMLIVLGRSTGMLRWHLPLRDRWLVGLRMVAEVAASLLFLAALVQMPLANLSAIMQFTPLAVTLAAAVFFRQTIGWRRLSAILLGLVGVMLIVRPGPAGFDIWALAGLASVGFVVVRDLASSRISPAVSSVTVSVWSALAVAIVGGIGATVEGWQPIRFTDLGLILFAAVILVIGYIASVGSMRVGDIAIVAPFRYTALLWAIVLGWVLFGSLPDRLTMFGAALVVGTGVYTFWREGRLRARVATP
jgi:drug/metabolite transporter (DMT)-like permease